MKKELYIIVHNIRSAYNVGAIFRTSDGAGVRKIYLSGYTPRPQRFAKASFSLRSVAGGPARNAIVAGGPPYATAAQKMIAKTALGAEIYVEWEYVEDVIRLIERFKRQEISVLALEQDARSVSLEKVKIKFPCALIVGNETEGIEKNVLDACDAVISIPMRGKKESLNVSVAAGIAMYVILVKAGIQSLN